MLLWFVFGVFGIVPEVLKMLVVSQFWGLLWGGLFLFILGFEGLGVFVLLVFVFVVCVAFVSVCLLCFCFVVGLFLVLVLVLLLFLFFLSLLFFVLVFVLFCFFFVVLFFCCFVFWRVKGQVRWPKGPPHLALNPPYFRFFCFFFFAFLSLLYNRQKTCFPPKKGHFCCSFFCVSLCFFLAFLGPPPFSLSLSWCLSCYFISSFLSVSHFCILFLLFLFFFFQAVLQFLCFFFFCLLSGCCES